MHQQVADEAGDTGRRSHRLRLALLLAIPLATIALGAVVVRLLDSRPVAGVVGLLGCALWITTLATDVGQEIPRRDRLRYSGLNFGRKS